MVSGVNNWRIGRWGARGGKKLNPVDVVNARAVCVALYISFSRGYDKLLIDVDIVLATVHEPDHAGAIQGQAVVISL